MNPLIKLLLVDDHTVVREGLRLLLKLQPNFKVMGEACNGDTAIAFLIRHDVDVVILDMKMPGTSTFDLISTIKRLYPRVHILIFTSHAQDAQVQEALEAGATGYLLKDARQDDLVRAIHEVAAGRVWLHPQVLEQMLEWMRRPLSPIESLTAREHSVLIAIIDGLTNKEIAHRLQLAESTVKNYVSIMLEKLNVADRTQAALLAQKLGLARLARGPAG